MNRLKGFNYLSVGIGLVTSVYFIEEHFETKEVYKLGLFYLSAILLVNAIWRVGLAKDQSGNKRKLIFFNWIYWALAVFGLAVFTKPLYSDEDALLILMVMAGIPLAVNGALLLFFPSKQE